jgi:hypothetical protein
VAENTNSISNSNKLQAPDFTTMRANIVGKKWGGLLERYVRECNSYLEARRKRLEADLEADQEFHAMQIELLALLAHKVNGITGQGTTATAAGSRAPKERALEPVGAGAETG